MGFMGLDNWRSSDSSVDFVYNILHKCEKLSGQEKYNKIGEMCLIKVDVESVSCYNTPGWIDVILYIEDYILHDYYTIQYTNKDSDLYKALIKAKMYCEQFVSECDTRFKLDANRMYNNIIRLINEIH